jgi:hypothetical protein
MYQMPNDFDWRRLLTTSESKSRSDTGGNRIQFSSIDGWATSNAKLIVIWTFKKSKSDSFLSKTRPGKKTKKRDLGARVESYELFLITPEMNCIVPWTESPSHSQIVKIQWTQAWHEKLKIKAKKLNQKYDNRPIKIQYSFKNIGGIMRLQYEIKNYKDLPPCPDNLRNLLSPELDKLIGAEFRLWKDLSMYPNGPKGWLDNKMAEWEHNNIKHQGLLKVKLRGEGWEEHPDFQKGRQDYWTGFAIDFLMDQEISFFEELGGHVKGADHKLNFENKQTKITDYENTENKLFSRIKKWFRL